MFEDTLRVESLDGLENYRQWAGLRDVFLNLNQNMSKGKGGNDEKAFEKLLLIAHYNAMRCACTGIDQLEIVAAKLSISLLRHVDILPADKAFYEAGKMSQVDKTLLNFS